MKLKVSNTKPLHGNNQSNKHEYADLQNIELYAMNVKIMKTNINLI